MKTNSTTIVIETDGRSLVLGEKSPVIGWLFAQSQPEMSLQTVRSSRLGMSGPWTASNK